MLAGISSEYYLRLEQGRHRNPLPQVLDALARVLRLDATATAYLHELAAPRPRTHPRRSRRRGVAAETAQLLEVIWLSAVAVDEYFDVLAANALVATFRNGLGPDVDDPRAVQLVGELSLASEEFRRAWARHDVKPPRWKAVRIDHPQVGEMRLWTSKLEAEGADGVTVIVYHAAPGTADAERLALLASLAAGPAERRHTSVDAGSR